MSRFESHVDELLRDTPRITAGQVTQIIRERIDPTFQISERAAREYVAARRAKIVPKEAFVRLVYAPADQMQFDFKDVVARIGGVEIALHVFVARLSYSTAFFAHCYRTEGRLARPWRIEAPRGRIPKAAPESVTTEKQSDRHFTVVVNHGSETPGRVPVGEANGRDGVSAHSTVVDVISTGIVLRAVLIGTVALPVLLAVAARFDLADRTLLLAPLEFL